ncbi:MAG: DUF262 domain-containing HNH endonuclease family protein [Candidatus Dormiibacterota bacterium]
MPDSHGQIGFEQGGIGSVLRRSRLVVPPNQRDYAWLGEVYELYQDLKRAMGEGKDYFLGTIVTIPRDEEVLEVVDGQQRLATTALLLAAIRDHDARIGEPMLAQGITGQYLSNIDLAKRQNVPRLRLNTDDNDLFAAIVSDVENRDALAPTGTAPTSQKRLLQAFAEAQRHVEAEVKGTDAKDQGNILNRLTQFIESRALVVLLKVPDSADAYTMFETLNDRGLRTSQADLIKNHLFGKSGERFQEVQVGWAHMRGALEALDDDDVTIVFVRNALTLLRGYLRTPAEAYEAVQRITRAEQPTVTFVRHLESLAQIYVATFSSNHERWNDYPDAARRAIEALNAFKIKPMQALILAIASKMERRQAADCLSFCVSLGVRLMLASTIRSGGVEGPLSEAARKIFAGDITTAAQLKTELKALTPSDALFCEAFERARVTNANLARYYLRSLEMTVKEESEPWFMPTDDAATINLEHVLPEKPEDNWPGFTSDDVYQYSRRLGNLALMLARDNSNLRSAGFSEKREVYARSPYELTRQLADTETWTTTSIAERQKTLARWAVQTWPTA